MNRFYYLSIVGLALLFSFQSNAQQRYLSEIFTDVTVTQNVIYANNITVLSGAPASEDLLMDVYEPTGDTETERPVVIVAHTGQYLPVPLNGAAYGEKIDSSVVNLCKSLAKRGFVAIAYTYRLGWNPNGTQDERTGTYINAYYRGTQDAFSLIRFLRMNADTQGNTFGIDTTRIISGGMGTGGEISTATAFLDKQAELELTKFFDFSSNQFYIDTSLSGNIYGTQQRPLNIANNPSYSNELHFAFNLGGYVGDSTWVEAGDIPMVSFHSVNDPFSPYDFGAVIVPTTGDFVVNVSGSKGIQRRQNVYGNNNPYSALSYADPYTAQADLLNNGMDGLYPFYRPTLEDSPWNYWDAVTWDAIPHPSGGTFHSQGLLTNPDMSETKALAYLDTVANYLCPRIVCALNLPGCPGVGLDEISSEDLFSVYPNPTTGEFTLRMENNASNKTIRITDFSGKLVYELTSNDVNIPIEISNSGVYVITVSDSYGVSHRKIVVR